MAANQPERLHGWKATGRFLGVDARTARRWEAERGLPVRRLPGGDRASVWADPGSLSAWLATLSASSAAGAGRPPDAASSPAQAVAAAGPSGGPSMRAALLGSPPAGGPDATPAGSRRLRPRHGAVALLVAGLVAAGGWWLAAPQPARPPDASRPYGGDEAANLLFREASFAKSSRTVAGLEEAAGKFGTLAREHPQVAAAHAGLAETWLLMREFGRLPDEAAYRRARDAAEAALALAPQNPAGTRALGFVLFWSDADRQRGLELLERSTRLTPVDARAHHWLGNALAAQGRTTEALAALAKGRSLAPDTSALAADEAYVRWLAGDDARGRDMLDRVTRVDPNFIGAWRYLEWIALTNGDDAAFLAHARRHATLRNNAARLRLLDEAETALGAGGRPAMLAVLTDAAEQAHAAGAELAINVARLHAAAGNRTEARAWLDRARAVSEPYARMLPVLPEFRALSQDPEFAPLFAG